MRTTTILAAGALAGALVAQPSRSPDIFLAPLTLGEDAGVGTPVNITRRDGYDNQPAFAPDGDALYFTAVHDDGQADIYRYAIATRAITPVIRSPESEYSATPVPGSGGALSVVRVERDSAQRLWRVREGSDSASLLVAGVRPVGYHAWADERTLACFVLGSPNTLQLVDLVTGRADTITTGIGRSLHRVPGSHAISFVQADSAAGTVWIKLLEPATREVTPLVRLPEENGEHDYAWAPDGSIVTGQGSRLLRWTRRTGEWRPIADFTAARIGAISRIAISADGSRIAFVADVER